MADNLLVILCTCPDSATAKRIAQLLVEQRLAACVNIIPQIVSVYRWEGKIVEESECQLIIKTRQQCYSQLEKVIKNNHPYKIPEIIAFDIAQGLPDYLAWVESALLNEY